MGILSTLSGLLFRPVPSAAITASRDVASSTRLNYANALEQSGRRADAIAIYWDMLDSDPSQLGAAQNLTAILIEEGQYADAILIISAVLDQYPRFSPLWCNFSHALTAMGDHERAFTAADRAVRSNPTNSMAYYNRAECHWHFGRRSQAIADYDLAVALDPSNVEISQKLHLARFAVSDAVHDLGPVKHEIRAHGAFIADGVEVASTLQCPHHGGHFPSLRKSKHKCLNCDAYTCDNIDCMTTCTPYQRQLEEAAKASANASTLAAG